MPEANGRFSTLGDGDTPLGAGDDTMEIGDLDVPLFGGYEIDDLVWALWNLILSIAGVILVVMMAIRILVQRNRDREADDRAERRAEQRADARDSDRVEEEDREERRRRRYRLLLILAVPILAIIAIIVFILTQNMNYRMVMVDWWTVLHAVIFILAVLSYVFAIRRRRDMLEDDDRYFTPVDAQYYEMNS